MNTTYCIPHNLYNVLDTVYYIMYTTYYISVHDIITDREGGLRGVCGGAVKSQRAVVWYDMGIGIGIGLDICISIGIIIRAWYCGSVACGMMCVVRSA